MPVVSVEKLSKTFRSGSDSVKALDSVDLSIKKGEVFGLLGPNGAGKTTLISVLCGFLIPDHGRAEIFGLNCTTESEKVQKRINLASGFSGISYFFKAGELLHFYALLYGLDKRKERVANALRLTGLENYSNRTAADFSSGLGRRFLISKALLNDPEVLLLDEPTVGLDIDSASNLRKKIKDLKRNGTTILLTTHNMKEAEELCDRVALIRQGKIIACGTFAQLKKKYFPCDVIEVKTKELSKMEKLVSKKALKIQKSKTSLKIYLKKTKDVQPMLKLITNSGIGILAINMVEPELEDLYTKVMRS